MTLTIQIKPRVIALALVFVALLLCVISVALEAYEWHLGVNNTYWAYKASNLFSVNREGNIPTWFSVLLLLSAAITSMMIARHKIHARQPWRWHWVALSLLLLYLSLDEAAAIHEIFTVPLQESSTGIGPFTATGPLYFAWVFVGIPFSIFMVIAFLPFVLALPRQTKILFFLAGGYFVTGALGIEAISANEWYRHDGPTLLFSEIGAVEEFFEMVGVTIMIYGLLLYLSDQVDKIEVTIAVSGGNSSEASNRDVT